MTISGTNSSGEANIKPGSLGPLMFPRGRGLAGGTSPSVLRAGGPLGSQPRAGVMDASTQEPKAPSHVPLTFLPPQAPPRAGKVSGTGQIRTGEGNGGQGSGLRMRFLPCPSHHRDPQSNKHLGLREVRKLQIGRVRGWGSEVRAFTGDGGGHRPG